MTECTTLPGETLNLIPASPLDHTMVFARMPALTLTIQEVSLPGVSAQLGRATGPGMITYHHPDRLNYEPLNVTFLVDEQFLTHRELHRWLAASAGDADRTEIVARFIEEQQNYVWEGVGRPFDYLPRTNATLTLLNGAKVPMLRVLFHNVMIASLGEVRFSATATDVTTALSSTATFNYDYYSIITVR